MGNWASYHSPPAPQVYARTQLNAWIQFANCQGSDDRAAVNSIVAKMDPLVLDRLDQCRNNQEAELYINKKIDEWTKVLGVRDVMTLRHIKHAKRLLANSIQEMEPMEDLDLFQHSTINSC